jgi:uncharacterized protein (TIGR03437 family)
MRRYGPLVWLAVCPLAARADLAPTTTTLTMTAGKPVYGSALTFQAAVNAQIGSVVFIVDGQAAVWPEVVDGRGSAFMDVLFTTGTHTVGATYSASALYGPSTATPLSVAIGKATSFVQPANATAQIGQPVTLNAYIGISGGSGQLSGTASFAVAGCSAVPLENGFAHCSTSFAALGTFAVAVNYSGDGNAEASSAMLQVSVGKAVAGVYLASAPEAPVYGQPATIGALLLGADNVAVPTGTIAFSESGRTLGIQPVGSNGRASFSPALNAGPHSILAVYSGDANYQSTTSAPGAVMVSKAGTVTSLTAVGGGPFTAYVSVEAPGAGSPGGTVQFRNGTTVIAAAPLVARADGFTAVLAASTATGSVTAVYSGDGNFAASASNPVNVYPAQTQVSIASDRNPSQAGEAVAFTVAVLPRASAGPPTGSVALSEGSTSIGSANLSAGQAVFHLTLGAGSHVVTARYAGDASYAAASTTITQLVNAAGTTLTLTSSSPSPVYGQDLTLTARLGPQTGAAPPAGEIRFGDGGVALGTAATAGGVATLPVALATGSHTITASWPGDSAWGPTSATLVQTINKAGTSTVLAIAGGQITATVSVTAPGAGSPGGSVRFLDAAGGTSLATVSLIGLTATAPLPASADAVVAVYTGDDNFLGSISTTTGLLSVTNAASYVAGVFAPDQMIALFGPDLASATLFSDGAPADALAGTTVTIADGAGRSRIVPLLFVSPAQAAAVMPSGVANGPATLILKSASRTLSAPITVAGVAPGLFTADSSGRGAPAGQVVRVHSGGAQDEPQAAGRPIDLSDPDTDVYLVLYATGLRHATAAPVCTVGGRTAAVVFMGAQAAFPGLDQVNILLPHELKGGGAVTLTLAVDRVESNPVTLVLQ